MSDTEQQKRKQPEADKGEIRSRSHGPHVYSAEDLKRQPRAYSREKLKRRGQMHAAKQEPLVHTENTVKQRKQEHAENAVKQRKQEHAESTVKQRKQEHAESTVKQRKQEHAENTVKQESQIPVENTVKQRTRIQAENAAEQKTQVPAEESEKRKGHSDSGERAKPRMSLAESERMEDWKNDDSEVKRKSAKKTNDNKEEKRTVDAAESDKSWQQKLRERKKRRIRRIIGGCGTGMAVIYIAAAVYFGFHFYEGTEIFGIDCSQRTAAEVKAEAAVRLMDYQLQIEERNEKTEYLNAEQIGLEFVDNNSIDRMLKAQRSYIWPVMMLLERSSMASVAFSYDEEKVLETLNTLDCMDPLQEEAPQDAYIRTTDTGFVVEPEVMGTTLDAEKTKNALFKALDAGETVLSWEEEDCYVNPKLYEDDEELQRVAAEKSALAKAYITYDFGDRKEVVNAPVIENWIVLSADGSYVIDDMKVTNYVEELAVKYDTFGLTREFYTSLGTTVTLSGGDYGWCMDQDATVVALLNALSEGYQGMMEPEYVYTAKSRDTNDIGYTYVEICISQQRMWCYENGTCIVDTPVVTGNPNKGNATPSGGVWAIDAMKRDAILVGEGYRAPVSFWMPFNGDVGIHDLTSRAYFGGSIYLSNGSHGCVNTPYAQAEIIFNTVSIGTPVIVYD